MKRLNQRSSSLLSRATSPVVLAEQLDRRLLLAATAEQVWQALDLPANAKDSVVVNSDPLAIARRTEVKTGGLLGFPSGFDEDYLVMSTGVAGSIVGPNSSGSQGTDLGTSGAAGDTCTVSFTLPVPASTVDQKMKFDFMFLSEEYPEYVGTSYNDFFSATVNGQNIAKDQNGNVVDVNNVFFSGASAAPTFFDGRTSLLTASYAIPAGTASLNIVLSIGDVGDGIYDSAALVDNFRFEQAQTVWVNFAGTASFTLNGVTAAVPAFDATDVGFPADKSDQEVIDLIYNQVKSNYSAYDINFTSTKPAADTEYMEVQVGGNGTEGFFAAFGANIPFGQASAVDVGNLIKKDFAVINSAKYFTFYSSASAGTYQTTDATKIAQTLATTITHEIGHNLGLRHVLNTFPQDVMKQNSPRPNDSTFKDELYDTPASEFTSFPDSVKKQNSNEYLKDSLGTVSGGTGLANSLAELLKALNKPFLFDIGNTTIYDVQVGTYDPGTDGGLDADVAPQITKLDSLTGQAQINLANYGGKDKFFLLGSTKKGGPVDVTSGALNASGQIDIGSSLTDQLDSTGTNVPTIALKSKTGATLKPLVTATLAPSAFTAGVVTLPKNKKTFTDTDGDIYTVSMTGPGTVQVVQDATDGKGALVQVLLSNTTAKSALSISVKKVKGGDGRVTVGTISSSTSLASIKAPAVDLTDSGIAFTGDATVGTIALHDLIGSAGIALPGSGKGVALKLGSVDTGATLSFGAPVKSLYASGSLAGTITSTWFGTIASKGELSAKITASTNSGKGVSIVSITGGLIDGFQVTASDAIKSISSKGVLNGTVSAGKLDSVTSKGDSDLALTLNDSGVALKSFKTGGALSGTWNITGGAGSLGALSVAAGWNATFGEGVASIAAKNAFSGSLTAQSLKTFSVTKDVSDAIVRLTGDQTVFGRKPVLASFSVGGTMTNSTLRSTGNIASAKFGALIDSKVFAGMDDGVTGMPTTAGDFVNTVEITSLKVTGVKGATTLFSNSQIAAAKLGTIGLRLINTVNAGTPFGVAATGTNLKSFSWAEPGKKTVTWNPKKLPADLPAVDDFLARLI